jgi:hypothetical protein
MSILDELLCYPARIFHCILQPSNGEIESYSARESLGYYELKKTKRWFDEGCSKLLHHRKQAKLQWLQDPSEINGNNLNNIKLEGNI